MEEENGLVIQNEFSGFSLFFVFFVTVA